MDRRRQLGWGDRLAADAGLRLAKPVLRRRYRADVCAWATTAAAGIGAFPGQPRALGRSQAADEQTAPRSRGSVPRCAVHLRYRQNTGRLDRRAVHAAIPFQDDLLLVRRRT